MKNNIQTFIACDTNYEDAKVVLFGAPFDGTTSFRPGTRFAPNVIRNESFGIETYSPYQNRDLLDMNVFDEGDLEFPFGNPKRVLEMIEENVDEILKDGKIPFMIGGEHLVSLGAIRSLHKKYHDLHILHFDAHCDLRDEYLGEQLSHACVMRRVWELVQDGHIHQFGIRSGEREEFEFAQNHTNMCRYDTHQLATVLKNLKGCPIYVTLDLDVLDPSIFPGTGTPEAGGIGYHELQAAMQLLSSINIVGLDVNELSPSYDQSGVSTAVACKVIRELLLLIGGYEK